MSNLRIITDHKWKPFRDIFEVPKKVLNEDFDWLDEEDTTGFIKYKNRWFHISEFEWLDSQDQFPGWHGIKGDTYFSGTLIKVPDDGESYMIGRYYS